MRNVLVYTCKRTLHTRIYNVYCDIYMSDTPAMTFVPKQAHSFQNIFLNLRSSGFSLWCDRDVTSPSSKPDPPRMR